jgi:hypothetical protein
MPPNAARARGLPYAGRTPEVSVGQSTSCSHGAVLRENESCEYDRKCDSSLPLRRCLRLPSRHAGTRTRFNQSRMAPNNGRPLPVGIRGRIALWASSVFRGSPGARARVAASISPSTLVRAALGFRMRSAAGSTLISASAEVRSRPERYARLSFIALPTTFHRRTGSSLPTATVLSTPAPAGPVSISTLVKAAHRGPAAEAAAAAAAVGVAAEAAAGLRQVRLAASELAGDSERARVPTRSR